MQTQELDDIDQKILSELQRDGRLSHQNLSDRIGLSPSPCARRVRNLETSGVITGYRAEIDPDKLGFGFNVFVSVKLDRQIDDRIVSFEQEIGRCPEIVECWLMTGQFDYLLRVSVRNLNEFESFLTGRLTKLSGVASMESSVPIRQVKHTGTRLY